MRIIKPYGQSRVEDKDGKYIRLLRRRQNENGTVEDKTVEITVFAEEHAELVIAQWISVIDMIISKPKPGCNPTQERRDLREKIGNACWEIIKGNEPLSGLPPEKKQNLEKLWRFKISPYGKEGQSEHNASRLEGRWYKRFVSTPPKQLDQNTIEQLACAIREHLYTGEKRKEGNSNRKSGRIELRAASIAGNVLAPKASAYGGGKGAGWGDEEENKYKSGIDVAYKIHDGVMQFLTSSRRSTQTNGHPSHPLHIAAARLSDKYLELFKDGERALTYAEARESDEKLFTLHMAVKDCYTRLLKRRKNSGQKKSADALGKILPRNCTDLFSLIQHKGQNRDLNHLVRLGKIIHYQASPETKVDCVAGIAASWPGKEEDIETSIFWTSDGQARIKRNEALVRVWRHTLTLANRTLTSWADPKGRLGDDILGSRAIEAACTDFCPENHRTKMQLLFGNCAGLFCDASESPDFGKGVMKFALRATADMRNSAFHFKGLGSFINSLKGLCGKADSEIMKKISGLWNKDKKASAERLLDSMRAADFGFFFDDSQNSLLWQKLSARSAADLPLPRFGRMIQRAQETDEKLGLPKRPSRQDMESSPARRCQYTALKLVYEGPFRAWLGNLDTGQLQKLISRAVKRATEAARTINRDSNNDIIVSRASHLEHLAAGETIERFFFRLSEATATEMRVQNGYESDSDKAREQAGYIENLKCEVTALAFACYIKQENLTFITSITHDLEKPETPKGKLPTTPEHQPANAEGWQKVLYFLMHLVPVAEAGRLLHQLRKWDILASPDKGGQNDIGRDKKKNMIACVRDVLSLYLAMHDAKFEGGEGLEASLAGSLFENEDDFRRVFPPQSTEDDRSRIPLRGLREMQRFGDWAALRGIFEKVKIRKDEVDTYLSEASGIAAKQTERENLHAEWVSKKKGFEKLDAYKAALADVTKHRHLASRVLLTDHLRLHYLLASVLGRLVDFSGLWERDLYFVTLALMYEKGSSPKDIFNGNGNGDGNGLEMLCQGQIIQALKENKDFRCRVERYFGKWGKEESGSTKSRQEIRNNLAHFNMLRDPDNIDLTCIANQTRHLMSYDRKLKNAVSKSIKDLLAREGVDLEWKMSQHALEKAVLTSRQAMHLGKKYILENLHSDGFVQMLALLFGADARGETKNDVTNPDSNCTRRHRGGSENHRPHNKKSRNDPENFRRDR